MIVINSSLLTIEETMSRDEYFSLFFLRFSRSYFILFFSLCAIEISLLLVGFEKFLSRFFINLDFLVTKKCKKC